MELEKLTKSQTVLLTLFVSFVTSIATGITTVTLMDQAPPGVTNTISKVVQTTIERVVPEKTQGATTIQTVVVKEGELIAGAVESNKRSRVILSLAPAPVATTTAEKKKEGEQAAEPKKGKVIALGFIISADGMMVTDSTLVSDKESYLATLPDGTAVPARVAIRDEEKGIVLLALELVENKVVPVKFANSDDTQLGETVIALGGVDNLSVLSGIISRFDMKVNVVPKEGDGAAEGETEELEYLSAINTNIVMSRSDSGSMLFNTDGKVVGMNVVRDAVSSVVPANMIKALALTLAQEPKGDTAQGEQGQTL